MFAHRRVSYPMSDILENIDPDTMDKQAHALKYEKKKTNPRKFIEKVVEKKNLLQDLQTYGVW